MTLVGFLQAFSVIGIMPIVDLVLNENKDNASTITLLITDLISKAGLPITIYTLGAFYLFIVLIKSTVYLYQQYETSRFILSQMRQIILEVYKSFIEAAWMFFGTKQYGTLSNTVVGETQKATIAFESLALILSTVLSLIFYLVLAFLISWQLTLISTAVLAITFGPFWLIGKYVYKIRKVHTQAYNEFQGLVYDTLNALKLIIGFGKRKTSLEKLDPVTATVANTGVKFIMVRALVSQLSEPITIIAVVISVTVGLGMLELTVGALFGFLYVITRVVFLVQIITSSRNEFKASEPSFEQIFSLSDEAKINKEHSGNKKVMSLEQGIEFENLNFSYKEDLIALNKINLSIPKGKMIAIVGPSGSGKSTLIDLIMGFQVPDSGKILIDGKNLNEIELLSWRELVGYIPQQPFLFNSSINENLKWANENASQTDINNACKLANASEFISDLEEGYDTVIGERGLKLSGGQAQRLCLARALVRDQEILILDEATSSLDSNSEKLIQDSIDNLTGQKTIISVAHRLSTIKNADLIYYLYAGEIVEKGTFEELIKDKEGHFFRAAKLQGV